MTDPLNAAGQQRDERADDEELAEFYDTAWRTNTKESFDIHRGDDRTVARVLFNEYTNGLRREAQRQDRLEQMFLAQLSNQQQVQNRDQLQSTAHRDLAVAQEWRDQARDSGESVFVPKQSS